MNFINKDTKLNLEIDFEVVNKIKGLGIKMYPNEFGGFLIGKYSDDLRTLIVTDFVLPKKYKSCSTSFERSTKGVDKVLKKIFETRQEYYVGEWHTHPNGSTLYSRMDLQAMKSIAKCKTVSIKNPILLILSIDRDSCCNFTFYCYKNKKMITYEKN